MIDPTLAKTVAELGVPTAVIVVLLAFAIIFVPKVLTWFSAEQKRRDEMMQAMQERMTAVVENNTRVVSTLCATQAETSQSLDAHDKRAERIEQTAGQILRVVDRTEKRVEQIHEDLVAKQ